MAKSQTSGLDQRTDFDCRLRQYRHCVHSRGSSDRPDGQLDDHGCADEQEQDPVQVSQDGRDARSCFGYLLG